MKISSIFSFYHFKYIVYSWLTASHVTHLRIVQRGILAVHAFMNIFEHHKVNESHWWFDWEIDKNFERESLPEHGLLGIVYSCTTSGNSKFPNSRSHGQHTLWSNIHLISCGNSICKSHCPNKQQILKLIYWERRLQWMMKTKSTKPRRQRLYAREEKPTAPQVFMLGSMVLVPNWSHTER